MRNNDALLMGSEGVILSLSQIPSTVKKINPAVYARNTRIFPFFDSNVSITKIVMDVTKAIPVTKPNPMNARFRTSSCNIQQVKKILNDKRTFPCQASQAEKTIKIPENKNTYPSHSGMDVNSQGRRNFTASPMPIFAVPKTRLNQAVLY